jgi:hypothetical protein
MLAFLVTPVSVGGIAITTAAAAVLALYLN